MKKLLLSLVLVSVYVSAYADLPSCPSYQTAQPLFLHVPSVSQFSGPAGYQVSQYISGTSDNVTTSYNYYSQTSRSAADTLQQIHNLSALLHTAPIEDSYQLGNVNYKQCIYWGSMSGQGVPSGNQVLSIQYSQPLPPPPPTPLVLQAVQALPGSTVVGHPYIVLYKLTNNNVKTVNYTLEQTGAKYVTFNEKIDDACNVDDQESQLAANTSCNIEMQFNDPNVETYPATKVMTLTSDEGVDPDSISLQTSVRKLFADNVIMFGDSLSDVCAPGPYVNNDPVFGKRNWAMDFVAETAVYAQGLNCWKNPGIDILQHNVDYAVGGARIKDIPGQITNYENALAEHKGPNGQPTRPGLNTKFIFWIGGNDLLAYDPTTPTAKMQQDMDNYVDQLTQMIHSFVIANGIPADNVYVINMPNIGAAKGKNVLGYTNMANYFNKRLQDNMASFEAPNDLKPTVIDSYDPGMSLFLYVAGGSKDPNSPYAKYGFEKALMLTPCNHDEHGPTQACKGYMSYDGTHPDRQLYQFFSDTFSDVVDPKQSNFDK